ncbi:MAG: cytochrome P450 [Streptosporangiaceae bacterium]
MTAHDSADVDEDYLYFEMDDGYSFMHRLGDPVRWIDYDIGMWLVGGYQELKRVLKDDGTFSSAHEFPNGRTPRTGVMQPPTPVRAVPIEIDPPAYRSYRKVLAPRFGPAIVAELTPDICRYTDWCLDQFIETGRGDLFRQLVKLVPAMLTLRLIGLPIEDADVVSTAIHHRGPDRFHMNPTWRLLFDQIAHAVRARREERASDLISYLIDTEINGKRLNDLQIYEICFTVVVGGMSTTGKLLLGALSYFGVHLDQRRRVIAEPELLPTAIEEFLRYYSPVPLLARTVTRETEVAGQRMCPGDRAGMGFAAANRDPSMFDEPNEVRIDRSPNRHMAFGHGLHFCVGASLGRAEALLVLQRVLARIPDYRLAIEYELIDELDGVFRGTMPKIRWSERLQRGLPVTFTPGAKVGAELGENFTMTVLDKDR